jgi:hypothetical protein
MPMNKNDSKQIAENAIRWTNNILVEILSNHVGPHFPETAKLLRTVTHNLSLTQQALENESKDHPTQTPKIRGKNDQQVQRGRTDRR